MELKQVIPRHHAYKRSWQPTLKARNTFDERELENVSKFTLFLGVLLKSPCCLGGAARPNYLVIRVKNFERIKLESFTSWPRKRKTRTHLRRKASNSSRIVPRLRSSRYIGTRSPGAKFCRRSAARCSSQLDRMVASVDCDVASFPEEVQ